MSSELEVVTDWLVTASKEVPPEYFQLPVAGSEEPEYRERVYCYELYHRWRCKWTDGFRFSLGGEINKQGHPLIRGDEQPDFLVHVPGRMRNLLIVEVKPVNAAVVRMGDDLKKLTRFRRELYDQDGLPASYDAAYLWLYGLRLSDWPALRERLLTAVGGSGEFDPGLVSCFVHEQAGTRAVPISWEVMVVLTSNGADWLARPSLAAAIHRKRFRVIPRTKRMAGIRPAIVIILPRARLRTARPA